tara:strand:+ start:149 stop:1459 length:1311 start_codon:yes stop_codon:yes gene_type:complete
MALGDSKPKRSGKASHSERRSRYKESKPTPRIPEHWRGEGIPGQKVRQLNQDYKGTPTPPGLPSGGVLEYILRPDGPWKRQQRADGSLSQERGNPNFLASAFGDMVGRMDDQADRVVAPRDPNAPLSRRETTPYDDPWTTGQYTPGYQPPPEERDLWDQYHDLQESFIKEGAATARTTIKDYQDFGLEQLGLDESALGVQIEAREAQTIGLMLEQEEIRNDDYEMLTEGQGGDVKAQNIYLAELGIDDPELFTTDPANESAALLGASYRAGAEVGRTIQHQVNFAANSIDSMIASGFSQSRQDLMFNVLEKDLALDRYVSENLAKVELARMQKKIDDEEASDAAKAVADYAVELVPMLGLNANLIMAMEQFDLLDPFVDQLWAPDEEQYYSVDPMNPNQRLANEQIASNQDIYKKQLEIIDAEENLKGMYDYDIRR